MSEVGDSQEDWRAIAGSPGYDVSDLGNVRRSALFDPFGRQVYEAVPVAQSLGGSPKWHLTRYMEVSLRVAEYTRRHCKVHHLVAEAFHGPRPTGLVVCHNDGDALNNRADNLRYDTQANNIADMWRHRGGHFQSRKTHCLNGHELTPENTGRARVGNGYSSRSSRRPTRSCAATEAFRSNSRVTWR